MSTPSKLPLWPQTRTAFVGRTRQLKMLDSLAADHRLLTVTGPGGMGKTRLALTWLESQPQEVYRCDLSHTHELEGMCARIALAIGIDGAQPPHQHPQAFVQQLGHALEARGPLWLLLDHADAIAHLAPDTVGLWYAMAPQLRMVVTSRGRLGLQAERVLELDPLALAPTDDHQESEAVALFMARAQAAHHTFEAPPHSAQRTAVKAIVAALDGIPLAIELAAAQMHMWTPVQLLRRIEDKLDLLVDGPRDMAHRHRTLRRTIDDSWQQLSPEAQRALAQCAVFEDGFSTEAAVLLIDLPKPHRPMAALRTLRESSWLHAQTGPGGMLRLGLYSPIRDYAHERLVEMKMLEATQRRHAHIMSDPDVTLQGERLGTPEAAARLRQNEPNLRQALAFATSAQLHHVAVALGLMLAHLYALQGPLSAWRRVLTTAIDAAQNDTATPDPASLGQLLSFRARLQALLGEVGPAEQTLNQMEHYMGDRLHEHPRLRAEWMRHRAMLYRWTGQRDRAEALYHEALALVSDRDPYLGAELHAEWASVLLEQRRLGEARSCFGEALVYARTLGAQQLEGFVLSNLGILCQEQGDMDARIHIALLLT
ncbi:MAG: AAA family ATPase, partial [Myxococcota bacterium]